MAGEEFAAPEATIWAHGTDLAVSAVAFLLALAVVIGAVARGAIRIPWRKLRRRLRPPRRRRSPLPDRGVAGPGDDAGTPRDRARRRGPGAKRAREQEQHLDRFRKHGEEGEAEDASGDRDAREAGEGAGKRGRIWGRGLGGWVGRWVVRGGGGGGGGGGWDAPGESGKGLGTDGGGGAVGETAGPGGEAGAAGIAGGEAAGKTGGGESRLSLSIAVGTGTESLAPSALVSPRRGPIAFTYGRFCELWSEEPIARRLARGASPPRFPLPSAPSGCLPGTVRREPVGVANVGASCYAAAALQAALSLRSLRAWLADPGPQGALAACGGCGRCVACGVEALLREADGPAARSEDPLQAPRAPGIVPHLLAWARAARRAVLDPPPAHPELTLPLDAREVVRRVGGGARFSPGRQEDAHEFLTELLDVVDEEQRGAEGKIRAREEGKEKQRREQEEEDAEEESGGVGPQSRGEDATKGSGAAGAAAAGAAHARSGPATSASSCTATASPLLPPTSPSSSTRPRSLLASLSAALGRSPPPPRVAAPPSPPPSSPSAPCTFARAAFGMTLSSELRCSACGGGSVRLEPTTALALDVADPRLDSLERALWSFFGPERLEGYRCERCGRVDTCQRRGWIAEPPNVLAVCLKRFSLGAFGKLTQPIAFPLTLDLAELVRSGGGQREKREGADEGDAADGHEVGGGQSENGREGDRGRRPGAEASAAAATNGQAPVGAATNGQALGASESQTGHGRSRAPDASNRDAPGSGAANGLVPSTDPVATGGELGAATRPAPPPPLERHLYSLSACIEHQDLAGSARFGHYVAYVRQSPRPENARQVAASEARPEWLLCDDEIVEPCDAPAAPWVQAYILLYERVGPPRGALGHDEGRVPPAKDVRGAPQPTAVPPLAAGPSGRDLEPWLPGAPPPVAAALPVSPGGWGARDSRLWTVPPVADIWGQTEMERGESNALSEAGAVASSTPDSLVDATCVAAAATAADQAPDGPPTAHQTLDAPVSPQTPAPVPPRAVGGGVPVTPRSARRVRVAAAAQSPCDALPAPAAAFARRSVPAQARAAR